MIDHLTVQKINDTADIVDVVSDYVHLIRRGANYMGLCPFHNERTPSFSVNRSKNFCYCFSCKKGGSPVNFIMQKEGVSYYEALMHLAKRYGIEVVEKELTDEERQAQSEREAMLVANEWAMLKMESDLTELQEGKDIGLSYLFQRGVTMEAIKKFHLGYAIDKSNHLCEAAKVAGYDIGVLKKLGLVGESAQKRDYDRFRGRVIFPIINSAGKVVAFGGRDLKGGLAKYINSPESDLYKKSNQLYGIFQARADIVKEDKCYLVEGYLDVIGMWQSGMRNTVASSGTALTDGQIGLIHRFSENITLIYDGDNAGIKAALRGIDMLLRHDMKVKVLLLPDGDDPDSFARKHTPEEFREYVKQHETDIIRFKTNVLLSNLDNDPQSKINATSSIVTSIAHISDQIARDVYIQECSALLNLPEAGISKSVAQKRSELLENWKREKTKKRFPDTNPATADNNQGTNPDIQQEPATEASVEDSGLDSAENPLQTPRNPYLPDNPEEDKGALYQFEKKIIQYLVRYGYLPICSYQEENEQGEDVDKSLDIVEYIQEELEIDGISFSNPVLAKIFDKLKSLKVKFRQSYSEAEKEYKLEYNATVDKGIREIADKGCSTSEIEKAEKKLYAHAVEIYNERLREFTKDYPGKQLASDVDDQIRNMAIELLQEPHRLSTIYTRDNNYVETEEDKIQMLVPRALTEWREGIINLKLNTLMSEFKNLKPGDIEESTKLQTQLATLFRARAQLAKEIGERIISPKKQKQ